MTDRLFVERRFPNHPVRFTCAALVGLAALALTGCGGKPILPESFVKTVPAEEAMVMPPPAGPAIVSVVERRFDNAISQDIHLANSASTPGQNMIKVQLLGTERTFSQSSNNLGSSMVSYSRVAAEMRQVLPGVRMSRSLSYVQNNYGPFGYAFGRGRGSDLCLYAWQQIRSRAATTSPFANYGSIQIRLRVCEAGSTEARLLGIMYNFTITAAVDALGWNPYGAARPLNPDLGGSSAPIYPRATASEPIVQPLPERRTIRYAPRVSRQVRAAAPSAPVVQATTQPSMIPGPEASAGMQNAAARPVVPSPGVASSGGSAPAGGPRVTVPSPTCAMTTDGSDVVCR
jgi:hypothetical protein